MSNDSRGRSADTPHAIPLQGWLSIAKRTYAQSSEDNVSLIAAGVAFYAFLALVPLFGALVLTYGLVANPSDIVRHLDSVSQMVPAEVSQLIGEQLSSLVETSSDKKGIGLLLALALAIFGAMKGAGAVVTALNIAYEETDKRGFIGGTVANALITVAVVLLAVMMLFAASIGHAMNAWLSGASQSLTAILQGLTWAVAAAATMVVLAALYRYGPSRANARWRWVSAGSVLATVGLAASSIGFARYAASLGNYNATYGSLGAVVVLLMWLYISAYVLLLGAELNSEIEHQTAVDTTTGTPRPRGERDAVMADEVAA